MRVFYDRLVEDKDSDWFLVSLKTVMKTKLDADFDKIFEHIGRGGAVDREALRQCFFGDYMDDSEEASDRHYTEIDNVASLVSRMEDYLLDHNSAGKPAMNLAIFLYAVEHISRVCRVLKQPGGQWHSIMHFAT